MNRPRTPIGLQLTRTSRSVSRAFDNALEQAAGSLPVWLVLLNLKTQKLANQRELAEAMGIREATLTHHLNGMDRQGLVTRQRHPTNRRVQLVELTPAGEDAFLRLRRAAATFDQRLRRGLSDHDVAVLRGLLDRLSENVGVVPDHLGVATAGPGPWREPAGAPGESRPGPLERAGRGPRRAIAPVEAIKPD